MVDRRIILRVLFGALGLSAVAGALAVLMGTSDVVGRVGWTGMTVAIACAMFLPLSFMADRAKQRQAALLGMSVVVLEFICAMALIWLSQFSFWSLEESLALTMLTVGLATPVAMSFLRARVTPVARWAGEVGLALTATTLAMLLITIWVGPWFTSHQRWWSDELAETAGALAGCGVLAVAALIGVGAPPSRPWRWLGVAAAVTGFVMAAISIWAHLHRGEENFIAVMSVAVVIAHANVALLCPIKGGQRWLLVGTIGAVIATAALVDLAVYLHDDESMLTRLAGAAGIFAACGTLSLLVLGRMNRGVNLESLPHEFSEVSLTCPRCQKKQKLGLGEAACDSCGLRININVEEPRCPQCGYLLYMLTSDRCPECGAAVAKPARAGAAGGDAV